MASTQKPAGENDGGVVIPLHGARRQRAPAAPPRPSRFDPAAREDELTGLHGHPWFEEDLRGASRRRRGSENPWVAVAAVEGLAELEASRGAGAADAALRAATVCIRDVLRHGDKVARVGEDRFGLIVDAPFGDEAMAALERVERAVRTLAATRPEWRELALSIGVAPLWHQDPRRALQHALDALGRARQRGGHCVQMSTASRPAAPPRGT
jgi:diguanylate cyclase (GGDEF)-like protein